MDILLLFLKQMVIPPVMNSGVVTDMPIFYILERISKKTKRQPLIGSEIKPDYKLHKSKTQMELQRCISGKNVQFSQKQNRPEK
jgi:hypothetical protein